MSGKFTQPNAEQVRMMCAQLTDRSVQAADRSAHPCPDRISQRKARIRYIGGRTADGIMQSITDQYVTLDCGGRTVMIPYHSIAYISIE